MANLQKKDRKLPMGKLNGLNLGEGASASNSDANTLAGDAAADSMARDVIPERQDGDLRQNAQVPESTRQFDLAGSNPPCEGMVYQRTDNRPSSEQTEYWIVISRSRTISHVYGYVFD